MSDGAIHHSATALLPSVIMPPSALDRPASLNSELFEVLSAAAILTPPHAVSGAQCSGQSHARYTLIITHLVAAHRLPDAEVHNAAANRTSHCGVLEFIAEEGYVYMPYWVRLPVSGKENGGILEFIADDHMGAVPHWIGLGLPYWEGDDIVRFRNATLPKGTYVKLQPHTKDFLDISNPKAVLDMTLHSFSCLAKGESIMVPYNNQCYFIDMTLRSFSCLTAGESIMVAYNNKRYFINVVDARPGAAISIIETDCEVDFAPPLDYVEPARAPAAPSQGVAAAPGSGAGDSEGGGKKSAAKDGKAGVYVGMERERGGEEV
ncbi:unnamed protein product [Closterium sp. NIES-64]|nr:unnamed protein product [Closterium sp. NIES-64]